jgi:hypothetical protein
VPGNVKPGALEPIARVTGSSADTGLLKENKSVTMQAKNTAGFIDKQFVKRYDFKSLGAFKAFKTFKGSDSGNVTPVNNP